MPSGRFPRHRGRRLRTETCRVVAITTPNGRPGMLHLAISNPSGDSAIIEHAVGKPVIPHGREYQVMTNSPLFDQQLDGEPAAPRTQATPELNR